ERRFQFTGRTADDAEDLGGRGLLLERFTQFVEQAHVLDGDDSLRGEILNQIYLLIVEGSDLLTIDGDDSNEFIVLEHRDIEKGPIAAELNGGDAQRIAFDVGLFRPDVGNLDYLLGLCNTTEARSGAGADHRLALPLLGISRWQVVKRDGAETIALAQPQDAEFGLADAHRVLQHRVE